MEHNVINQAMEQHNADKRDAARYRWLREHPRLCANIADDQIYLRRLPAAFDAAVDDSMTPETR